MKYLSLVAAAMFGFAGVAHAQYYQQQQPSFGPLNGYGNGNAYYPAPPPPQYQSTGPGGLQYLCTGNYNAGYPYAPQYQR